MSRVSLRFTLRVVLLVLLVPLGVEAQDPVTADTTAVVDSTALRIRQRLQLLNRGPGSDSARARAYADSIEAAGSSGRPPLAGPPAGAGGEDLYGELRGLPGYTVTEYAGLAADYSADEGVLVLHGDSLTKARVSMTDGQLEASSVIRFHEGSELIQARGDPVFLPREGDEIRAEGLDWRGGEDRGSARQAKMKYTEGAEWNVTSDFPEISPDLAYGHNARFTSCDLAEPHYHFETDELKIVRGSILVARPVRLYFGDVPVAWLPFMAQGLGRGRTSGLLTPRFSVNDIVRTSGGYRRRVSNLGFYWAMSEYSDASVAFDWYDDNYLALTGTTSYRWARKFMQGSLSFRRYWRAEGGTELTLNTSHRWEMSERTSFNMQAAYASSSRFVTQNSFNPTEVTQSIDSQGGLSHRFDWGNLSLSGNRRQFLSDDRVEQTLPSLNLSLSPITLFPAPQTRSGMFNNITLSGGGSLRRSTTTRAADDPQPDVGDLNGSLRSSLTLGRLSFGGGLTYRENSSFGVAIDSRGDLPRTDSIDAIIDLPEQIARRGAQVFQEPLLRQTLLEKYADVADIADSRLNWNASISFQQNLIGSTTLTPRVSWDGELRRADTVALAHDFVSAPTRVSFGADLRSDLYGFLPGFGPWDRIRHKISPSFGYRYSPEVQPTDLQKDVFGSSVISPRNVLTIGLNQTFEARLRSDTPEEGGESPAESADSTALAPGSGATAGAGAGPQRTDDGFLIPEQAETQLLLAIQTSMLSYDFVADSTGRFVDGLTTASLNNTIRSDFLRGLTISMRHDLFDETSAPGEPTSKSFSPHLEGMNFSYGFSDQSTIFRWLGLGGGQSTQGGPGRGAARDPGAGPAGADDPMMGAAAEESIVPTSDGARGPGSARMGGPVGAWSLNLGYSLIRPRATGAGGGRTSQNLSVNMSLKPTDGWDMAWRTSYDLENGGFNDHIIRLTRELHRWEANFDFLQTASGNWSFRFEVRLLDNEELKFDYQQRSLDRIGGDGGRLPTSAR